MGNTSNILVTGGKGFVGKHLVECMRRRAPDYRVSIFDKDGFTGARRDEWDGIVHLAALPRVGECEKNPQQCINDNVLLTTRILQESFQWFILASTATPPENYYGMSKRFCEQMAEYECRKRHAALRIFRFTNITGDGENQDKLLPRAVEHIKHGTPFKLSPTALPLEYTTIDRVVDQVMVAVVNCRYFPGTIGAPEKIVNGRIKTEKQLMEWARNVAHTDAQPA